MEPQAPDGRDPENLAVVYFGSGWFGENRTSSHHIAELLSHKVPLIYVDCPGIRVPQATARDWRKIGRILITAFRPPQQLDTGLWHMTLPQIPFRNLPAVRQINEWVGRLMVSRAVRKLGFGRFISWFLLPHIGALAGRLKECMIVYYCTDDYASFPGMDADMIRGMDDDLTRKADQVFVTSSRILERKKKLSGHLVLSPHGVDAALFGQAADREFPVALQAASLPHPVIGFFGLVGAWIDTGLIQFLAEQRPHWTFLIIGSASVPTGNLERLPNVVLPGPQPYRTLPHWAKAFDVAIIPYRQNEQVMSANPLKLREYLATGKPVVTVWTPEVERFLHCVRVGNSPEEFLQQIEEALRSDTAEMRLARMEAVKPLTWESRVDEVWETVLKRLSAQER